MNLLKCMFKIRNPLCWGTKLGDYWLEKSADTVCGLFAKDQFDSSVSERNGIRAHFGTKELDLESAVRHQLH